MSLVFLYLCLIQNETCKGMALDFFVKTILPFAEAVLGIALVICTLGLFRATRTLARETELLRKVQTEPRINIRLEPHPTDPSLLQLVLANEGQGPAKEICCGFVGDSSFFRFEHVDLRPADQLSFIENGIAHFASNQTFRYMLGTIPQSEFEKATKATWTFDLSYKDIYGNEHEDVQTIEFALIVGVYYPLIESP